jgi:NAD(P)-dependent dehydrogenase (short-subunit alcohol dehydrogenase family)
MAWGQWNEVLQVDLNSVFLCCQRAMPDMIEAKFGRIVNIASIVGQLAAFGQTNYAAAKAGIIAVTRSLAQEVARHGITVNAICPGYVATAMVAQMPTDVLEEIKDRIPLKRLGTPEEIAAAAAFLIEDGSYITGTTINVNGGLF